MHYEWRHAFLARPLVGGCDCHIHKKLVSQIDRPLAFEDFGV